MTRIADAARRAADWLEANPANHIARHLALDARGVEVRPTDPNATCFCAIGRLGKELELNFEGANDYKPIEDLGIDYDTIIDANDEDSDMPIHPSARFIIPAHPEQGIAALRELAK